MALPLREVAVRFSKQRDVDTQQKDDEGKAYVQSIGSPDIRAANTGNNDSVEQTGQRTSHGTNQQRQTPSTGLWAPCCRQNRDDRPDQKDGNKSPSTESKRMGHFLNWSSPTGSDKSPRIRMVRANDKRGSIPTASRSTALLTLVRS